MSRTLIQSLIPCVDSARDILTRLGARPYTVRLIWTRWSGGERGVGIEEVVRDEPILPTPEVDLGSLARDAQPVGALDAGSVRVAQISARYTEDFLLGRACDGAAIPEDQNFYWEIAQATSDGCTIRRRFIPSGVPTLEATKFQWTVQLTKVAEDRTRAGDVRG